MAARPPVKKRNLYEVLGVERDAMALDIGMAYKRRLAELAKDPNPDPNELGFVRQAYQVLCQPKEREAYDASLITREEKAAAAAQAQAQAPDLELEPEAPPARKPPMWMLIAGALVVVVLAMVLLARPDPAAQDAKAKAVADAEAPVPPPAPPPPPPQKRSAEDVLALARASVARMVAYDMSGTTVPAGSGLVVAPNAVVTTCHGLPPSGQVVASLGARDFPATLTLNDEQLNLCRFSVPGVSAALTPAPEEPKAGDAVYVVAYPQGKELSVLPATVKGIRTTAAGRFIEISIPVPAAASGGALFDAFGRFAGVLTSRHRAGAGVNAALPAAAIAQMRTRDRTEKAP